jgi:hypothetical protein
MNRHVRTFAVGPSLPASPPAVAVLAGDLLVVFAFIAMGIANHGGAPLEAPQYTLERLAPFLLAWLVVAPLAGVYHRETLTDYRRTLVLVVLAWLVAAVAGSALRESALFPGGAPLTFVLVTVGFGTVFLLVWRVGAVWLRRRLAG